MTRAIEDARRYWTIDPEVAFLNHGSYGATPAPVLDEQARWRVELERNPIDFLNRQLPVALEEARTKVAAFIGADPEAMAFVANATTGANVVAAGLGLHPGDEVVMTDHAYGAVHHAFARRGAEVKVVPVPLPLPPGAEVAAAMAGAVTDRTRLVVVDHIASPTGVIFPVAEVVAACRDAGVPVLVDAAHGPGQVDVDVTALGADAWVGNFHKWVCAPKTSAALVLGERFRSELPGLVISHANLDAFPNRFEWPGTLDPSPHLSVPAAIDFFDSFGWATVRSHNHELAGTGREIVASAVGTMPAVSDDGYASMALVELPGAAVRSPEERNRLQDALYRSVKVEVPAVYWGGRSWLRLSAQLYNRVEDYERLAVGLARLVTQVTTG